MVAKCDIRRRPMGENRANGIVERDNIPKIEMDIEAR
jgi:hypothetical protein